MLLADLKARFGNHQLNVANMLALTPTNLLSKSAEEVLKELEEFTTQFDVFFPDGTELIRVEVPVLQSYLSNKTVISLQIFSTSMI